ncbi:hypothetical protein LOK49_LG07G02555 [Camellia lanceoleosa]|uniref:Uncharacterized protein n=1 Tax=Camellia lanceoleosa TaxID=1840588 RepID=A0ACC0H0A8_9ERIC|nr:hypothetical protein LOK49_LG07G02555 [Camellia lanceoleosa]
MLLKLPLLIRFSFGSTLPPSVTRIIQDCPPGYPLWIPTYKKCEKIGESFSISMKRLPKKAGSYVEVQKMVEGKKYAGW